MKIRKIVAIGGGEIGRPGYSIETKEIDQEIIRLSGKKHPKALLLPTASGDSPLYYPTFEKYYGSKLGCKTDVLYLYDKKIRPKLSEVKRKIMDSDIIYVGGGNTLRMLKLWRRLGVDRILAQAYEQGKVMCGVSAGAICWPKYGNSDSMMFGPSKSKRLIRLKGLDFVDITLCPHYDAEKSRQSSVRSMVKKYNNQTIALENCSAIEIINDKYRIMTSKKTARAYKVYKEGKTTKQEEIPITKQLRSLEELK